MLIQLATPKDYELLVQSRIDFMKDYWGEQEVEVENRLRAELHQFFEVEIPAKTYVSFLAMEGEKLIGVGGMKISKKPGSFRLPSGLSGYIMNMYTIPEYRNQGIATEILKMLEQYANENGIQLLELHATQAGQPVYEKFGFKVHGEPTMRKFN